MRLAMTVPEVLTSSEKTLVIKCLGSIESLSSSKLISSLEAIITSKKVKRDKAVTKLREYEEEYEEFEAVLSLQQSLSIGVYAVFYQRFISLKKVLRDAKSTLLKLDTEIEESKESLEQVKQASRIACAHKLDFV